MLSIKSFHCNVGRIVIPIIYFSLFSSISPHFLLHLPTFRDYSFNYNAPELI